MLPLNFKIEKDSPTFDGCSMLAPEWRTWGGDRGRMGFSQGPADLAQGPPE